MPVFVLSADPSDEAKAQEEFEKWLEDNEEQHRRAKVLSERYYGLTLSQATLCGAVLQYIHSAIQRFSKNQNVPSEFQAIVRPGSSAAKACIGRKIRGVPLGLVIYAGRNQYAHWEDGELRKATREAFDRLATDHGYGNARDPAFDLKKRQLQIYSHNIVGLIDWSTYESCVDDLRNLLDGNQT